MMVSTIAGGRPLKSAASRPGATHGGSIDLDAGAIWCRAPERGGPSSEECAREVLSRGKWVRETRSGWANGAQPAGPAPRPPWACTVSVRVGSLGETHTCVRPEASCVPVRLCWGGPRSGRSTAGSGRNRGKQTGLPELLRIDSRSAGSSWVGVATLRGMWSCHESASAARLSCPGMWTARSDLNCVWLQRRRWRASYDMRCDRIPPSRLMYETAAVLSVRNSMCLPNSSGRNCCRLNALPTAPGSWCAKEVCLPIACSALSPCWRHLLWQQYAGTLVLGAPRASRKAKVFPGAEGSGDTAGRIPTRSVPQRHANLGTRECSPVLKWSHVKQSERRDCSCGCHMPQGASEIVSVVPHSCLWRNSGSSALLGHVPPWGVPFILTESNSTPRKDILLQRGELALFPVDPKPQLAEVPEHQVPVIAQLLSWLG